jgi:hypothetical protein
MPKRPGPAQPALPGIGRRRGKPVARVRRGVEDQLKAQRDAGTIERVDAGLIAIARTLADDVDAEHTDPDGSRFVVGALVGKLMPVLMQLRGEAIGGDGVDVELDALRAAIRDATQPGAGDDR